MNHEKRHENTRYAAKEILTYLFANYPSIRSVIDVGCGVGTWLSICEDRGREITGIDKNVPIEMLEISPTNFINMDLRYWIPEKRYDLAICLEVAEHLTQDESYMLIDKLSRYCNNILFSAAIPKQGGEGHINEQWQSYWLKQFIHKGMTPVDLRSLFWFDERIPVWYRQNMFLFNREYKRDLMPFIDIVHPDLYLYKIARQESPVSSFKMFLKAVRNYVSKSKK